MVNIIEKLNQFKLHRSQKFWDKIIITDGLARSGKSVLSPILASFENVDIERIEFIYEKIAFLAATGKITKDAAVILLQTETDSKIYQSQVGRNMNFRFSDHSSVFHHPFTFDALCRLLKKDGQERVDDIIEKKPVFQIVTHDILGSIDIFFDAFDDKVLILEMVKHPIDQIYSYYKRGWPERLTTDPRATSLTFIGETGIIPWTALFMDGDYNKMDSMDRIISINEGLLKRNLLKYNELDEIRKSQIIWVMFDDFTSNTERNIKKIESFIGRSRTKKTAKQIKKERCPRIINQSEREEKEIFIRSKANEESLKKLDKIFEIYRQIQEVS